MRLQVFRGPQRLCYVHLADQGGQVAGAYQPDLTGRSPTPWTPEFSFTSPGTIPYT